MGKARNQSLKPTTNKIMNVIPEKPIGDGISIKDLRLEDKKRVADLIKVMSPTVHNYHMKYKCIYNQL